jgi:hypothetical protein
MALLPAALVAIGRRRSGEQTPARQAMHGGALALLATVLAATMIVVEVSIFRQELVSLPLAAFAREMLFTHAIIGAGEGLLTGLIVYAAQLQSPAAHERLSPHRSAAVILGMILVITVGLSLSSNLADGYESAAERSGWSELLQE